VENGSTHLCEEAEDKNKGSIVFSPLCTFTDIEVEKNSLNDIRAIRQATYTLILNRIRSDSHGSGSLCRPSRLASFSLQQLSGLNSNYCPREVGRVAQSV